MNRNLSIASLVLSIVALIVSISIHLSFPRAKSDPALVRELVDAELRRRETELVATLAPKMSRMYKDMLGKGEKVDESALNPKTLSELFKPLVDILDKMQGGTDIPPQR